MDKVTKMFVDKLIENNADKHYVYSQDMYSKIEQYEEQFRDINLFKKKIYDYGSKYYLQNKQKNELTNIQESLKQKVDNLNYTFSENFYFLNINKEKLEKTTNKHKYNIFKVFLIEYQKINLLDDILFESDICNGDKFYPIKFANMSPKVKIELYEDIISFFKKNKKMIEKDKENNFEYHNKLIFLLRKRIASFFLEIYKKDKSFDSIMENYNKLMKSTCYDYINTLEILNLNLEKNNKIVNKIIDLYLKKKWDINMNILNCSKLNEIMKEKHTIEIYTP